MTETQNEQPIQGPEQLPTLPLTDPLREAELQLVDELLARIERGGRELATILWSRETDVEKAQRLDFLIALARSEPAVALAIVAQATVGLAAGLDRDRLADVLASAAVAHHHASGSKAPREEVVSTGQHTATGAGVPHLGGASVPRPHRAVELPPVLPPWLVPAEPAPAELELASAVLEVPHPALTRRQLEAVLDADGELRNADAHLESERLPAAEELRAAFGLPPWETTHPVNGEGDPLCLTCGDTYGDECKCSDPRWGDHCGPEAGE